MSASGAWGWMSIEENNARVAQVKKDHCVSHHGPNERGSKYTQRLATRKEIVTIHEFHNSHRRRF